MSNQWKVVPSEPTAEMEDAGCLGYMAADGMIGIMHNSSMGHAFRAMLAAAPVPPAGDVEVIACAVFAKNGNIRCWSSDCNAVGLKASAEEGSPIIDLIDRAHASRLTAERDGLLAEVERLNQWLEQKCSVLQATEKLWDSAQSELTKARELLAAQGKVIEWATIIDKQAFEQGTQNIGVTLFRAMGDALAELARQSAPAACRTPTSHECPGDGVGACSKCPNAPAAKGGSNE